MHTILLPLWDFIRGILNRYCLWVPPLLLDPFDIFERWIRPHLPDQAQRFIKDRLDMVLDYGLWIFLALFGWAAFLTYREVHQKANTDLRISVHS